MLDKRSQYKKAYNQSKDKIRRRLERIGELQVELRQEQANVAKQSSERAYLRRGILDRDSVIT